MFALLTVQAFQVQPKEQKHLLWDVFNENPFPYDQQFYFKIDIGFKNQTNRPFSEATLDGFVVNDLKFEIPGQFNSTIFTSCTFINCCFLPNAFINTSFVSCRFYNCFIADEDTSYNDDNFTFYGCSDDNNFVQEIYDSVDDESVETINLEKEILDLYFKKGSLKPRHRQLSQIKLELSKFDYKTITKALHKLKTEELLILNGDLSHLSKKGIAFYNESLRNLS